MILGDEGMILRNSDIAKYLSKYWIYENYKDLKSDMTKLI